MRVDGPHLSKTTGTLFPHAVPSYGRPAPVKPVKAKGVLKVPPVPVTTTSSQVLFPTDNGGIYRSQIERAYKAVFVRQGSGTARDYIRLNQFITELTRVVRDNEILQSFTEQADGRERITKTAEAREAVLAAYHNLWFAHLSRSLHLGTLHQQIGMQHLHKREEERERAISFVNDLRERYPNVCIPSTRESRGNTFVYQDKKGQELSLNPAFLKEESSRVCFYQTAWQTLCRIFGEPWENDPIPNRLLEVAREIGLEEEMQVPLSRRCNYLALGIWIAQKAAEVTSGINPLKSDQLTLL